MSIAEKLQTIAENQEKVYEAGQKSEYDKFWDGFQEEGRRLNYSYAFTLPYWTDVIYNPKYPIRTNATSTNAAMMFYRASITDTKVDITIYATNSSNVFHGASSLVTIRKLIVNETVVYSGWFSSCTALKNITFEGVIGQSINLKDCPLSRDSITNIFEHLSTTASGVTATFNKSAVESAFTDAEWQELVATRPNWTVSKA